jgi:hypothetical protein
MWLALVAYFALVALRVGLNYRALRNYLKLPLVERPAAADALPAVTLIVPEEEEPAARASLEAQAYPAIDVADAPEGAGGEWLLFPAAGAVLQPEALDRLMRFALERRVQAVSVFLQQRCVTLWERVLVPFAFQQAFTGLPHQRVNDPADALVLASGHCLLARRDAYLRAMAGGTGGGDANGVAANQPREGRHGRWAGEQLAEARQAPEARLKALGVALITARGERLGSVRASLGHLPVRSGAAVFGALLAGLAIPAAIYGLAAGSRLFELAALVTYVISVTELALWQFLCGAPVGYALLQPLAVVLFLAAALRARPA